MANNDNQFVQCNLFELPLAATRAHGGRGEIRFRRIATSANFAGACNFIDFTCMPAGTTIGEHTHADDEEEFYLILGGRGIVRVNGEEFEVQAGDLIRNPPNGTHSLENTSSEELRLFVFEVQVQ